MGSEMCPKRSEHNTPETLRLNDAELVQIPTVSEHIITKASIQPWEKCSDTTQTPPERLNTAGATDDLADDFVYIADRDGAACREESHQLPLRQRLTWDLHRRLSSLIFFGKVKRKCAESIEAIANFNIEEGQAMLERLLTGLADAGVEYLEPGTLVRRSVM